MSPKKHTNKAIYYISGIFAVLCIMASVCLHSGSAYSQPDTEVISEQSIKIPSHLHRSPAHHSSQHHISLNNKSKVKLLMKKDPLVVFKPAPHLLAGLLSVPAFIFAKVFIRPGYYLFLFRYALF